LRPSDRTGNYRTDPSKTLKTSIFISEFAFKSNRVQHDEPKQELQPVDGHLESRRGRSHTQDRLNTHTHTHQPPALPNTGGYCLQSEAPLAAGQLGPVAGPVPLQPTGIADFF